MTTINWGKPIEAVHRDGTVVPMRFDRKIWDQGVWLWQTTWHPADNSNENWEEDGADCVPNSGWRIRNVAEVPCNSKASSDPIAKRMEALEAILQSLAFFYAGAKRGSVTSFTVNGQLVRDIEDAIVALLPEPVDADLAEAREICLRQAIDEGCDEADMHHHYSKATVEENSSIRLAVTCLRRGRALERDSREG